MAPHNASFDGVRGYATYYAGNIAPKWSIIA